MQACGVYIEEQEGGGRPRENIGAHEVGESIHHGTRREK
jgi:hypothetical protein